MNSNTSRFYDGISVSERYARNITDGFALAWIFTTVLAGGLMLLSVNVFTLSLAAFAVMLGGIWWVLSNIKSAPPTSG
jgi:hypothetical protein